MELITRAEALERGLTRYYTGKPCKHGHVCERTVRDWYCVECGKQSDKRHRHKKKSTRVITRAEALKNKDPRVITRAEALERGLKHYYTGKPCKHGHVCERYTGDWCCVECRRGISSKFREENPEQEYKWKRISIEKARRVKDADETLALLAAATKLAR